MTTNDIYNALSEPFPREVERSRRKGGTNLTYIPVSEVIARMNRVIGIDNWSSETLSCYRDAANPDWVIAHVRVTAKIGDATVHRDGWGGQQIKVTKNGDIVDLGDEFKGAESDAFKKACQKFGVGLYLARTDEALDAEEALAAAPAPAADVDVEIKDAFTRIKDFKAAMDEESKVALEEFWVTYSGGRPKPTMKTATIEDLNAILAECVRLTVGGDFVDGEAA